MRFDLTPASEKKTVSDTDILLDEIFSSTKDAVPTTISDTKKDRISSTNLSSTNLSSTNLSSTKYMNSYKREKYDTIRVDFPKGTKAVLQKEAEKRGISLTRMIKNALKMYLGGEVDL